MGEVVIERREGSGGGSDLHAVDFKVLGEKRVKDRHRTRDLPIATLR